MAKLDERANFDLQELLSFVNNWQPVRLSLCVSVLDCLCRGFKRKRRQKAVRKLQQRYMKQLDVRSIIANSLAFQDFTRCFLTRH